MRTHTDAYLFLPLPLFAFDAFLLESLQSRFFLRSFALCLYTLSLLLQKYASVCLCVCGGGGEGGGGA